MAQLSATIAQYLANKQSPVAILRLPAAAHQSYPMLAGAQQKTVYCGAERRPFSHWAIEGVPFGVVVVFVVGPSAEFLAEVHVSEAAVHQRFLKLLTIEVRCEARVGVRAHVYDERDLRGED